MQIRAYETAHAHLAAQEAEKSMPAPLPPWPAQPPDAALADVQQPTETAQAADAKVGPKAQPAAEVLLVEAAPAADVEPAEAVPAVAAPAADVEPAEAVPAVELKPEGAAPVAGVLPAEAAPAAEVLPATTEPAAAELAQVPSDVAQPVTTAAAAQAPDANAAAAPVAAPQAHAAHDLNVASAAVATNLLIQDISEPVDDASGSGQLPAATLDTTPSFPAAPNEPPDDPTPFQAAAGAVAGMDPAASAGGAGVAVQDPDLVPLAGGSASGTVPAEIGRSTAHESEGGQQSGADGAAAGAGTDSEVTVVVPAGNLRESGGASDDGQGMAGNALKRWWVRLRWHFEKVYLGR